MKDLQQITHKFESYFGSETLPGNLFSNSNSFELDKHSQFPDEIISALNKWGMANWYIPRQAGGELENFAQLYTVVKLMARRDLSVAIAHAKTFLGAVSVWCAASEPLRAKVAADIKNEQVVSLALTERDHGSDVSANMLVATRCEDGYRLNGEKFLINNATRSHSLSVFARTDFNNNSRDFSLFLVEKSAIASTSWHNLPKARTHGIKGADISGLQFNNTKIVANTMIGEKGTGLETVLKGFQLSRTMCGALSVGAADTALRLALSFCRYRYSGSQPLIEQPLIKKVLINGAAEVLIRDMVTLFSHRAINQLPAQMNLISAHVKGSVSPVLERTIESIADILGARGYLEGSEFPKHQEEESYLHFGKLLRDVRLISLFDGNTVINQQSVLLQLKSLARWRKKNPRQQAVQLACLFNLSTDLSEFKKENLTLTSHGQDDITNSLRYIGEIFNAIKGIKPDIKIKIQAQISQLQQRLVQLDQDVSLNTVQVNAISPEHYERAQEYTQLFSAACCINAFIYSSNLMHDCFQDGLWLCDILQHLNGQAYEDTSVLLHHLDRLRAQRNLLSVFPYQLATCHQKEELI